MSAFETDTPLPRRALPLPELWLEWAGSGTTLPVSEDDVERAVAHVAAQVQDWVMEEVWTVWPPCPGHRHPREVDVLDGTAVWACPADASRHPPIGRGGLAEDPGKG